MWNPVARHACLLPLLTVMTGTLSAIHYCRDPWPSVQSLPQFLRGFESPDPLPNAYSGLGVHWIIFGSSGHKGRPTSGVLRAYSRCLQLRHGQHTVVKTIVRTA